MTSLPSWNPHAPDVLADPASAHDRMRQTCPVAHSPSLEWSVFRHADISRILSDPHTFSSRVSRYPAVPNGMDPPEHTRYRRLLDPYFSAQRMAQLAPQCQSISQSLVKALPADDDVECMDRLATPYALRIQCAFLGWPDSMHAPLRDWITQRNAVMAEGDQQAQRDVAMAFDDVIRRILAERRALGALAPDDPTASLMRETIDGQPLDDATLVSILRNWTVGELGTIAASVGILIHYLATQPAVQGALRAQPDHIAQACDEILRMHAPLATNRRITTRACTLSGIDLPAGTRLTLMWGAGNRDDEAFAAPLEYRQERDQDANLLYGAGIHACPGAALARMALQSIVRTLLEHTQRIALACPTAVRPARWPATGFQQLALRLTTSP